MVVAPFVHGSQKNTNRSLHPTQHANSKLTSDPVENYPISYHSNLPRVHCVQGLSSEKLGVAC
jgi:hypothetical protein